MKIERVIVEIPEEQRQVEETAAVVADWRRDLAAIDTQLNGANAALLRAKKQREAHALAASLGDANAIAAIKHARGEQHISEQQISDLQIALPEAQAQLAAAEKAAASARHSLAMLQAEKLMRQRVAAAAELDSAFAAAAAAYDKYAALGREIQSFPDLNFGSGGNMSQWEGVTGFRRIAAAVPAFFIQLFPGNWSNNAPRTPLTQSEAHFWQLPEPDKAKAA